jgi:PAS domain S-box-containing protein
MPVTPALPPEPETEAPVRRWTKAAVAGAVLLTVLLSLLSWRSAEQATESAYGVAYTERVMTVLESTLRHSLDVETGGRAFAETGSAPFLQPYQSGREAVVQDLHALHLLLVTEDQLQRLNVVEVNANNQVECMEQVVATRQSTGKIPALPLFAKGKRSMDAIRITVAQMQGVERASLASRVQLARDARHSSLVVMTLASLLGVIFLCTAGARVSREIGISARARVEIKALNADLERRVEHRTAALQSEIAVRKQSEARQAQQAKELRHSQQALEIETLRLQSVLDSMVEGLIAADEHGNVILWNAAAAKILGPPAANLPFQEWSAQYGLFLPDTITPIPSGETPLERTLRGQTGATEIFVRHSGTHPGRWLETNGSHLIDKDGVVRGGVLAFRDITRRRTDELVIRKLNEDLEERIAERTRELQVTNDELETFSYSVSHDLRAPLRHISGFSRILAKDIGPALTANAREHLQVIENAVHRMGLMIDALLNMAVLRRQPLRLEHHELNGIVDDVIAILQPDCRGRDVEWRVGKLPALACDAILMAQVLQNLLGNALKYSRGRARTVIEVDSIQQPGKPAIIFVRDNGAGFDMKYAERLFAVFQRFHTESEFEGTGVGLATVHRIIQKHGGMIWVEAEPDQGATFYFALQTTDQIVMTQKALASATTTP